MFVVVGEALVDIVVPPDAPVEQAPGGSPLNVAVGLSRLGVPTTLVTELGDDANGRMVLRHLGRSHVRLEQDAVVRGNRTSTATARLDRTYAATYDFDLSWTLRPRPLPGDATGLHVGSIGAALRPGRDAVVDLVEQAHRRGLLISYDPNVRPAFLAPRPQAWRDVREVAARAHLVKLSDEDLEMLAPGREPADVAEELLAGVGPTRVVVVTHGGSGADALTREEAVRVPAPPVAVVDTVGAGDAFMAGLLAVLLGRKPGLAGAGAPAPADLFDGLDLEVLLGAAHTVAAAACTRRGADPPHRTELPPGWPEASTTPDAR